MQQSTIPHVSSRTLLAYGIAEWSSAIEHLQAMRRAGVNVTEQVERTLAFERRLLLIAWEAQHNRTRSIGPKVIVQCVSEARSWLTEHVTELDAIERHVERG